MLDQRIETFLAVCQTLNYTRAAERLHITQPAVSKHIHSLEQELGGKLFHYENRQISLTDAGQLLRRTATTMCHDVQKLQEIISQTSCQKHLRFGATLTIGEYSMAEPIQRLLAKDPTLQLTMLTANNP